MTAKTLLHIAALSALTACGAASASSVLDLGVASGYSGFFFGNVNGAADVEGRLAVGGNLSAGFDVGYRDAYASTAPALVVGGSVALVGPWGNAGSIYNGPNYNTNTNSSIGPSSAAWISSGQARMGDVVYGGTLTAASWQYGNATHQANYLDFGAAKTALTGLSTQLAGQAQIGSWSLSGGGVTLTGDGHSDLQIFDLGNTALSNITLNNVKAGAHVVINSTLASVVFGGDLGGALANSTDGLASHRDTLIFNLSNATSVGLNSFVNGSVLAVNAAVTGSGHLEGTLIADSLSLGSFGNKLEIGYEPFLPTTSVPEPSGYALLLAGLGLLGGLARRRARSAA